MVPLLAPPTAVAAADDPGYGTPISEKNGLGGLERRGVNVQMGRSWMEVVSNVGDREVRRRFGARGLVGEEERLWSFDGVRRLLSEVVGMVCGVDVRRRWLEWGNCEMGEIGRGDLR